MRNIYVRFVTFVSIVLRTNSHKFLMIQICQKMSFVSQLSSYVIIGKIYVIIVSLFLFLGWRCLGLTLGSSLIPKFSGTQRDREFAGLEYQVGYRLGKQMRVRRKNKN